MGVLEDIVIMDQSIATMKGKLARLEEYRADLLRDALRRGMVKEDLPHGLYLLIPQKKIRSIVNIGRLAADVPGWDQYAHIPGPDAIRLLGRDRVRDLVKAEVSSDDYLEALKVNVTDLKKALKKRALPYLDEVTEITGYHVHCDPRPIRVGGRSE